jgi:outer membrane biosynthesis protein TonB
MFKVIIAWITGGILPVIALSMTALVADNLKFKEEQQEPNPDVMPTPIAETNEEPANDEVVEAEPESVSEIIPDVQGEEKEESVKKKVKKPITKKPAAKKRQQVKTKQLKITPVKDLSEVMKVSKGSELIKTLQSDASIYAMESINNDKISDLTSPESRAEGDNESNVISTIMKNGEIIDKNYR